MIRFIAVAFFLAGCDKPARAPIEAPGIRLEVRQGQWRLLVDWKDGKPPAPTMIFDEKKPALAPPKAPVTLNPAGFDAAKLPPAIGAPVSYRVMVMTNDETARGAYYVYSAAPEAAYPLLWWGLPPGLSFDQAEPAANWARLKTLLADKP